MPTRTRNRALLAIAIIGVVCVVIGAWFYHFIISGGLIARQKPSALEGFLALKLVELSVPGEARKARNPLDGSEADSAAGRALYQKNCEACHGYDGTGKTSAGAGLYPPPFDLSRPALESRKRTKR